MVRQTWQRRTGIIHANRNGRSYHRRHDLLALGVRVRAPLEAVARAMAETNRGTSSLGVICHGRLWPSHGGFFPQRAPCARSPVSVRPVCSGPGVGSERPTQQCGLEAATPRRRSPGRLLRQRRVLGVSPGACGSHGDHPLPATDRRRPPSCSASWRPSAASWTIRTGRSC